MESNENSKSIQNLIDYEFDDEIEDIEDDENPKPTCKMIFYLLINEIPMTLGFYMGRFKYKTIQHMSLNFNTNLLSLMLNTFGNRVIQKSEKNCIYFETIKIYSKVNEHINEINFDNIRLKFFLRFGKFDNCKEIKKFLQKIDKSIYSISIDYYKKPYKMNGCGRCYSCNSYVDLTLIDTENAKLHIDLDNNIDLIQKNKRYMFGKIIY